MCLSYFSALCRLAPSLFRDISALRNIVTSAGASFAFLRSVLFKVHAPAEVTMLLSADISRNRLGASLALCDLSLSMSAKLD